MHTSITSLLDKNYELLGVDYQDNFDNSLEIVQKAIQTQDWQPFDETIDDWYCDAQWEGINYVLDNLTDDICQKFNVNNERAKEFIEKHQDELREIIGDRDNSDVIKDLLRHTENPVFFYDTGEYIENPYNEKEVISTIKRIKKILKIKDDKYNRNIESLLSNANYGGRLVIYFRPDVKSMMELSGYNKIVFTNPMVAIIDTCNGSGDNDEFKGYKFSLPLDTNNIFIDKCIKYSYVYDVCNMYSSFCDCTNVFFSKTGKKVKVKESSLHDELEREKQYNKTFKEGGCTPLDMDMQRHRDTYYLNEFPCGTHCPHCNTFWID